jgi:predicted DNA-binding transcriptional regulator AlpA
MSKKKALPPDQPRVHRFDQLPDSARLYTKDLCELLQRHRQSLWRYVRSGHLPKPQRLFNGQPSWSVGEIRKALEAEGGRNGA